MTTTDDLEAEPDATGGSAVRPGRRAALAVVVAVAVAVVGVGSLALLSADAGAWVAGRTGAPPWPAPTDVEQRAEAAGLTMLTEEGTVLHLHQHLSITVDGTAVTVPANLGIDVPAKRLSAIHTHDRTGILHVESPVMRTFHLGQVFTEWDVALETGRIGGYRDGRDGTRVTMFIDRRPYRGDPRGIVLRGRQDLDIVVTTDGSTPMPPAAYVFPPNY